MDVGEMACGEECVFGDDEGVLMHFLWSFLLMIGRSRYSRNGIIEKQRFIQITLASEDVSTSNICLSGGFTRKYRRIPPQPFSIFIKIERYRSQH